MDTMSHQLNLELNLQYSRNCSSDNTFKENTHYYALSKSLIKKLQECSTLGQADPILTKLGAGHAVKKLVETAIILNNSQDLAQRSHAFSFMESAIKELEDDDDHKIDEESPMGQHSGEDGLNTPKIGSGDGTINEEEDDDKDKKEKETHGGENKIHEEELSNHNQGPRTDGSEQSTDNTQPYPGEGQDSADGEKDMQKMDGTVNQWNETGGMPPPGGAPPQQPGAMPPGGMPPQQMAGPPGGGMILPGLAPDIAQEMGMGMPAPPPMDTSQQMRQMQYTLREYFNDYHKRVVAPINTRLNATINQQRETLAQQKTILTQQREAIKNLSQEIRETKAASGNLKFDLDYMRKNASATFRETTPTPEGIPNFDGMSGIQPVNRKQQTLNEARAEIDAMDKLLKSGNKSIYN